MKRLVLEKTLPGIAAALLLDDRLVAFWDFDEIGEQRATDAFFLGQVSSVDHRLGAAFLDVGAGRLAFLNAKDARRGLAADDKVPLGRLLSNGQRLIVQGVREAEGDKGPRVTTDLKLMSFHLIYRPRGDPADRLRSVRGAHRQQLQDRANELFPQRSVILRKMASAAPDDLLQEELRWLERKFAAVENAASKGKVGPLQMIDPLEHILQAALESGPLDLIESVDPGLLSRARRIFSERLSYLELELESLPAGRTAFEQAGVEDEVERALDREIALENGGRLIIEPTAAFVAIDVDGGGRGALDVNLAAASEIARLVKLRNLGGTIVIDFVDLPTKPQRLQLEAQLKAAFRDDSVPVDIYPMSPLGIVQISRARRGRSLDALLTRTCPSCEGNGRIASLRLRAETLFRKMIEMPSAVVKVSEDMGSYIGSLGTRFPYAYSIDATLPDGEWTIEKANR
ncbi:ribonuclease E/ribonuclease G [Arboricoccus pini]|uniref:Ribonuclease E/ribonuclease G n=1 Tax=Arboricoccus pini TaxID=1963835 RepID=A0A212R4V2_9PROT|nr:ribonuclease E/G [Arboricoccus pini]SNB67089.1 ribonuclease E/ribonuclease G [Arboricoccus pini]